MLGGRKELLMGAVASRIMYDGMLAMEIVDDESRHSVVYRVD